MFGMIINLLVVYFECRARDDLRCQFSPDPKEEMASHLAGYGTIRSGKLQVKLSLSLDQEIGKFPRGCVDLRFFYLVPLTIFSRTHDLHPLVRSYSEPCPFKCATTLKTSFYIILHQHY